MAINSIAGHGGRVAVAEPLAETADGGIERLCTAATADTIRIAPACAGIDRIEARFTGDAFAPHRHDTYAIGLTISGVQTFRYRGAQRYSLPGNIIVLHPDELHDGGAGTDAGLRYRMLYLPPALLLAALGRSGSSLPFVSSPVIADRIFQTVLYDALRNIDAPMDELRLDDFLTGMADGLVRLTDGRAEKNGAVAHAAVIRVCDYLRAHAGRAIRSQELETVSGLDRFALARQFRKVLNTSPHRYLILRRLEQARGMIGSGKALAEIALDAGFADQAHFSRHFKKSFGMTPGRWAGLSGKTAV